MARTGSGRAQRMGGTEVRTVLVAGGAGFIGSHVCERLIEQGKHVVGVDNLQTGNVDNLAGLAGEARFTLIEADHSGSAASTASG